MALQNMGSELLVGAGDGHNRIARANLATSSTNIVAFGLFFEREHLFCCNYREHL